MSRIFCKDRQPYVGEWGECLICDAAHGEACRRPAEGRKPDRAPAEEAAQPEQQPRSGGAPREAA